jgi:hypothetical protein
MPCDGFMIGEHVVAAGVSRRGNGHRYEPPR